MLLDGRTRQEDSACSASTPSSCSSSPPTSNWRPCRAQSLLRAKHVCNCLGTLSLQPFCYLCSKAWQRHYGAHNWQARAPQLPGGGWTQTFNAASVSMGSFESKSRYRSCAATATSTLQKSMLLSSTSDYVATRNPATTGYACTGGASTLSCLDRSTSFITIRSIDPGPG